MPVPSVPVAVAGGTGLLPTTSDVDPGRKAGAAHHLRHVDGLRAVAVLSVVAYHAGVPFVSGGYVGVDVFFVISGFLITGLLLREVETTGRIDLLRFYARRARRLLPAAAVVIVTVAALGALLLPPIGRGNLAVDVAAATLFVANWRYVVAATDYSAAEVDQSPLLHFWSLAVEEQYYLVWPLMLLVTAVLVSRRRRGRRAGGSRSPRHAIGVLLTVVLLVSLWLSVALTASTGTTAYFGLHTRAWELALGGLLAVGLPLAARIPVPMRAGLVLAGVLGIVLSAVVYTPQTPFPSYYALLPVVATAAVIVGGIGARGAPVRLLESRAAIAIGLVSYSWYLWHWPVLFFAGAVWGDQALAESGRAWGLAYPVTAAAVALSLLLAALSYRLVEQPLRFAGPLVRSSWLSLLLGLTLLVTGVGSAAALRAAQPEAQAVTVADGTSDDRPAMTVQEAAVDKMDTLGCHLPQSGTPDFSEPCLFGDVDGDFRVLLLGDSHAEHWLPALDQAGEDLGWQVESRTMSACNPVDVDPWLGREDRVYRECMTWRDAVLDHAAEQGLYDLVVVGRAQSQGRNVAEDGRLLEDEDRVVELWGPAALRTVEQLVPVAERVVVLGDNPSPGTSVPDCLSANEGDPEACTFSVPERMTLDRRLQDAETEALAPLGDQVEVVDVDDLLCEQETCVPVTDDGVVKFRDGTHLTETFARSVSGGLADTLLPGSSG